MLATAAAAALALGGAIAGFAAATGGQGSGGAIAFDPGIGYSEALLRLHIAETSGVPDPATRVVEALPAGVVAILPEDGGSVIIDRSAPFGMDTQLGIRVSATYVMDALPDDPVRGPTGPWPEGARLVIPDLPACMVRSDRTEPGPACGPDDVVGVGGTVPLP